MISERRLIIALETECAYWRNRKPGTQYVAGIYHGLGIARSIAIDMPKVNYFEVLKKARNQNIRKLKEAKRLFAKILLVFILVSSMTANSFAVYSACSGASSSCTACQAPVCCCNAGSVACQDNSHDGSGGFCQSNGGGNGSLGCTSSVGVGPNCGPSCQQVNGAIDQCTGLPAPSPSACNWNTICGTIKASEDGTLLKGVIIDLINASTAKTVQTIKSDNQGAFSFNIPDTNYYYVVPAVPRLQTTFPKYLKVAEPQEANFLIQGMPGRIAMTGLEPGTFVLFSPDAYAGTYPPPLRAGIHSEYYSAVAASEGTIIYPLKAGTYHITCWTKSPLGYNRPRRSQPIAVSPQSRIEAECH